MRPLSKKARKHHYIPKFYLCGFTKEGDENGHLYVFDKSKRKQWRRTPKNIAYAHDFYAVNLGSNIDSTDVESTLAVQEGAQGAVLKRTLDCGTLPREDEDEFGELIGLVALLAVRVPEVREAIFKFVDGAEKVALRALFATKKGQEQFRQFVTEQKHRLPAARRVDVERFLKSDPDLDELAEYARSDRYTVSYGQTWEVQMMLRMAITLMPWLALRNWSLLIAASDAPDLVCSDSPVSLTWAEKNSGPWPPGFGVPKTIVSVPLSKRIALVGMFEPLPSKRVIGQNEIALVNSATMNYANQVFSAQPDFIWRNQNGDLGGKVELLAALHKSASPM